MSISDVITLLGGVALFLFGMSLMGDGLKKREVGYLPQQTTAQKDFPASVWEVVLSGCLASKKGVFFSKEQKMLVEENMKKLDILPLRKKCYRELSGGQQQRVLLARALCKKALAA